MWWLGLDDVDADILLSINVYGWKLSGAKYFMLRFAYAMAWKPRTYRARVTITIANIFSQPVRSTFSFGKHCRPFHQWELRSTEHYKNVRMPQNRFTRCIINMEFSSFYYTAILLLLGERECYEQSLGEEQTMVDNTELQKYAILRQCFR